MVKHREDIITRATVLSDRLNKYLESYLDKTTELAKILHNTDEDGSQLLEMLADRQELIGQYDVLKREYDQLLKLSEGEILQDSKPEDKELDQKLSDLRQYRERLLTDVRQLDDNNKKVLDLQLEDHKVKLKQVKEGRLLIDTYFGPSTSPEGVFIDKRE